MIVAETLLKELRDPMKASHNHLSRIEIKCSWAIATDDENKAGIVFRSNNNI